MSTVVMHNVVSVDGYIADDNDDVGPLFEWYFNGDAGQRSGPNPALRSLDRPVGTWEKSDPSEAGAVDGYSTFEWMEGRYFLLPRVDLTGSKGIEVIGHDEESGSLRSHHFGNGGSGILEYAYELEGDALTVSKDMPRAKGSFAGKVSEDGNPLAGRWEWTEDGEEMAHDAVMTRVEDR